MNVDVSKPDITGLLLRYGDKPQGIKLDYILRYLSTYTDFGSETYSLSEAVYIMNVLREKLRFREVRRLTELFETRGITPLHLKGSTLAYVLFGRKYIRPVGDIDIYVSENSFQTAIGIMLCDGYTFQCDVGMEDPHHAVMIKGNFCVEVHKQLFPVDAHIDESAIKQMTEEITIEGIKLTVLKPTGMLLHLLYHHYGHIINDATIKLLMFPENYNELSNVAGYIDIVQLISARCDSIDWVAFFCNVESQKLSVHYKESVLEIQRLFPGTFPDYVVEKIKNLEYHTTKAANFYYELKRQIDANPEMKIDEIIQRSINSEHTGRKLSVQTKANTLSQQFVIDEYANAIENTNGSYVIDGSKPKNSNDISCVFSVNIDEKYLKTDLCIRDDVLVFHKSGTSPSFDRDSVCLRIATVYVPCCYRSILLTPSIGDDGEVICEAFEPDNEYNIVTDWVKPDVRVTEYGYEITAAIDLSYIGLSHCNEGKETVFYMDVQINDCDDENGKRKTALSFSCNRDDWYDPRSMAKFVLSQ